MSTIIELLNQMGVHWWLYVFHATWTSSLVAAVLLAVVWLGRRWPSQIRYAIVIVALLKFTVPPMLAAPVGLFSWFGPDVVQEASPSASDASVYTGSQTSGLSAAASALGELDWRALLMLLHVFGTILAASWTVLQLAKLGRLLRRSRSITAGPAYALFRNLSQQLGLRRPVQLLVSSAPVPPMAFGLLRRRVIVPASALEDLPAEQFQTILAHELAHHRRADLWIKSVQVLLGILWWFNPLFHLLGRALRKIREDCCDDLLLCRSMTTGGAYCRALLRIATDMGQVAQLSTALAFARLHPLGSRIKRIMDPGLRRLSGWSLGTVAMIVAMAALLLPGLSSRAPKYSEPNTGSAVLGDAQRPTSNSEYLLTDTAVPEYSPGTDRTVGDEIMGGRANSQIGLYAGAVATQHALLYALLSSGDFTVADPSQSLFAWDRREAAPDRHLLSALGEDPDVLVKHTSDSRFTSGDFGLAVWQADQPSSVAWTIGANRERLAQGLLLYSGSTQDSSQQDISQILQPEFLAGESPGDLPRPLHLPLPDGAPDDGGNDSGPIYADDLPDFRPEPFRSPLPESPDIPGTPEDNHRSPMYAEDSPDPIRGPVPEAPKVPEGYEQQYERYAERRPSDKLFRIQPYALVNAERLLDSVISSGIADSPVVWTPAESSDDNDLALSPAEAEPTDETISEVVDLSDVVTWAEPLEISATETSIVRTVDSSIRSPLVSAAVPEKYPTATELIRVGDSWALETPSSPSRSGLAEAGDSLFAGRTAAVAEPVYGIAAIPEPATLGLLWAAFLGLPLTRKRLA